MPRILITANHLEKLHECEIATLEITEYFLEQGWHVDVFTHLIGGEFEQLFLQLNHQERLLLTDDDHYPFNWDYDIVWLQHCVINTWLREYIHEKGIHTRLIFNYMSSFLTLDLPLSGIPENDIAYRIIAVSYECRDALVEKGINSQKITLFDNPVPEGFISADAEIPSLELKKALFISHHRPPELDATIKTLEEQGIECVLVGESDMQLRVTPELISKYDLVITSGKMVQYSLIAGVPVYIYDIYGGDGYLSSKNFDQSHYYNFSGRAKKNKYSGDEICKEIISGYEEACDFVVANHDSFVRRWNLNEKISELLDLDTNTSFVQFNETISREIGLHNKKLRKLAEPKWSYSKWYSSVQDSQKRLDSVEYILRKNDALIPIDIIIDCTKDELDVQATLSSIANQQYKVNKTWLLQIDSTGKQYVEVINEAKRSRLDVKLNEVILEVKSAVVLFIEAGDILFTHTLLDIAEVKALQPHIKAFYFDEEVYDGEGKSHPLLKPDINIDLLRSYPYIGKMLAFDVASLNTTCAFNEHYCEFLPISMLINLIEEQGLKAIGHISKVCYRTKTSSLSWLNNCNINHYEKLVSEHLLKLNINATIETVYINHNLSLNVKYKYIPGQTASIIIIANDDVKTLSACVEKVLELTEGIAFEVVLVFHNGLSVEVIKYLQKLADLDIPQIKILEWHGEYCWPAMNNMAIHESQGDIVVFMNPDMLIVESDWLRSLVAYFVRPEIGLVGPKIIDQDARVIGAGMVLGMNGSVGRIFEGESTAAAGYLNRLQLANNISALTHECLLVRKNVFLELSGFNSNDFAAGYSEVDLALRLSQNGYCHVFVPSVRVVCLQTASGSYRESDASLQERLYEKWLPSLHSDPAYNRNLSRHSPGFELSPYLADVHGSLPGRPLPVVIANNIDRHGCGYYRVIHPFNALSNELYIEGGASDTFLKIPDLAEFNPDIILVQPGARRGLAHYIEIIKKFTDAKIVLDYDDYSPNIPVRSAVRNLIKQDIIKDIRKDCQLADRIVVSTPALAEEFFRFSDSVVVAPNGLPREIWGNLKSRRRVGQKLRVGWAGGATHAGDLSILKPLMKAFENEIQWVFMGMQPEGIKCEYHKGVPIQVYPEKLASLDLDLALVPLEMNQFNVCKSNLRLLELGACGIPVICTDIEPYRCGLPVTLVKNEFTQWVNALKDHIHNPDTLPVMGDKLREAIFERWMLEGALLKTWNDAWTS
ncbi:glycosyltransferase [Enterobacter sp. Bisph1]|uniref:glycosyltransferase n=1 Tax=Enterobacter sp. Bisph1 TaxID=1274399 RepID=UPI00057C1898|nr:glycosyltransferase [Enterobacter sp. Bisph1]